MSEHENQSTTSSKYRITRNKSEQSVAQRSQQPDLPLPSASDEHATTNIGHQTPQESEPSDRDEEIAKAATLMFEHIEDQITLADTKAQLTLAADALLAGTIASLSKGVAIGLLDNSAPVLNRLVALFTILMFLSLVGSFYYALLVVRPSLGSPQRPTLMFFGQIVNVSEEDFIIKFLDQSLDELKMSTLAEVYAKARIAKRKFTRVQRSVTFLIASLVLWAVVELLLAFAR